MSVNRPDGHFPFPGSENSYAHHSFSLLDCRPRCEEPQGPSGELPKSGTLHAAVFKRPAGAKQLILKYFNFFNYIANPFFVKRKIFFQISMNSFHPYYTTMFSSIWNEKLQKTLEIFQQVCQKAGLFPSQLALK